MGSVSLQYDNVRLLEPDALLCHLVDVTCRQVIWSVQFFWLDWAVLVVSDVLHLVPSR